MRNRALTRDYVARAEIRMAALEVLFAKQGYADVVLEAQELVELASKALIRHLGAEPARVHDVSAQLRELAPRLPDEEQAALHRLVQCARELRRDRELAFYGTEDLTPSEFYSREDTEKSLGYAKDSLSFVSRIVSR
jgi:hypothetical protein